MKPIPSYTPTMDQLIGYKSLPMDYYELLPSSIVSEDYERIEDRIRFEFATTIAI